MSLKLIDILEPKTFKGVDVSPQLVDTALENGISARVVDVEQEDINGDVAVLWGVVHHFENPAQTLRRLFKNFNALIIRESINNKRFFELGEKYNKKALMDTLVNGTIDPDQCKIVENNQTKSCIVFVGD